MLELQPDLTVVGQAGTAENALAQVCQRPPDIVLLDWSLPGLHPQRLFSAMKQCCPQMLVIATSVKPEQREIALSYPVDGFLSKQLPPDEFTAALIEFIL
jgi:DNA-binding NarL/FixJ family response regulator